MKLKAPFPYFGGKSSVADIVWDALGQPAHYMEPFFGSGAVLLNRPNYDPQKHAETIVDADGFVANAWRAMQQDPDAVAKYCDWPVNHADLAARKKVLLNEKSAILEALVNDDEYYDPKIAGYWIWGQCVWIGSGMTSIGQRPHLSDAGQGVHSIGKRPHISTAGQGVHSIGKRPHLSDAGQGVQEPYNYNIYTWFRALSERLRYVRVVCGDWTRVCGGDWQDKRVSVGIFFDPPYAVDDRDNVYEVDSKSVAHDVRDWAISRGSRPSYRIVIAGYEEHRDLMDHGWTIYRYSVNGGMAHKGKKKTRGKENRHRECLYFSPHCLTGKTLFDGISHDPIMTTPQEEYHDI